MEIGLKSRFSTSACNWKTLGTKLFSITSVCVLRCAKVRDVRIFSLFHIENTRANFTSLLVSKIP